MAQDGFRVLQGKRVGLITNPSGVNRNLESTLSVLRNAPGVKLAALFGPEHGIYGDVPAGDKVASRTDSRTGLPVHSLYGATRKPTPKMLTGLDALVYDLQDTGCRSYTYISTMGVAMAACGQAGVEFVVLDRPNPLGGARVEGPLVESKFRSFVSRWDVPYVYGLTCGELAQVILGEHWITNQCKLTVVPMKGWTRNMLWQDTGLPWVPTSPHIPHGESPLFQVATGMLGEIGGVSTGIGYTLPFQCIAAPGVDPQELAAALNGWNLPGVKFHAITYKPFYFTFKDRVIGGAQLYFTEPSHASLTAINFYALETFKKVTGRDLFAEAAGGKKRLDPPPKGALGLRAAWPRRMDAKNAFDMFDKVNGTDATRKALQAGTPAAQIVASWKADEEAFRARRQKYLLY
ncbi:MAG: DUF1343 domain-containing protein [Verrucomicrobia bacterium]|nr:MAG: DUF1343 domain-containing protein [Verrucomicrobiota bacterium]